MRTAGLLLLVTLCSFAADEPPGAVLYKKHCATCHESGAQRMPTRASLGERSADSILKALEVGLMQEQGALLSKSDRQTVAAWLGKAGMVQPEQLGNKCQDSPAVPADSKLPKWADWGGGQANLRFQASGLKASDLPRLKLKWAFGVPNAVNMRSQPAVYAGRVYLGGQNGTLYSLDAATGCVHWAISGATQIRSGITVGFVNGRVQVFFGDVRAQVYAVDASTGQQIWKLRVDQHPAALTTATPVLHDGVLYVPVSSYEESTAAAPGYVCCTFRGSVQAIDAATGKVLWKTYTISEPAQPREATKRGAKTAGPSGAGIWSAPTLDPEKHVMYVTTGDNYSDPPTKDSDAVLAIRMDTGKVVWSKQITSNDAFNVSCVADKANCPDSNGPDHDFGSPAILVKTAKRRLLLLPQKSGMVHAVDPDKEGEIVWQARAGAGGTLGGLQWGSTSNGTMVYTPVSDIGFKERRPDPEKGGGIAAFRVDNGERVWFTPPPGCGDRRPCSPAQSGAASAIPGAVFSGSEDGHMRAYSSKDGKILWDFDTARDFAAVNGAAAKGGAIDAGGPVIAGDMVFFCSGYSQWGGLPGNVLLAFHVE